jgi:SAM-dependent methyltransferase
MWPRPGHQGSPRDNPLTRCPDPREALYAHRASRLGPAVHAELAGYLPRHARRVLDLGCGPGILTLQLAARAPFVIGLDLSPSMLALARERQRDLGCTNVAWVVARAEEPPFRPGSMDYIVSRYAIRLTDMAATLSAVRRLIGSGGRVAIRDRVRPRAPLGLGTRHLARTIRIALQWVHDYGGKGLWSILAYRASRAGLREARMNPALPRATFEAFYARELPGCRVETGRISGLVVWEAVAPAREPDRSGGPAS